MENGGIEWQTMMVAMATAEGGERERERGRGIKREKLKEIQIFKLVLTKMTSFYPFNNKKKIMILKRCRFEPNIKIITRSKTSF